MKTTLLRIALLFLVLALLPACVQLPGVSSSGQAMKTADAAESLFRAAEADYGRQAYRQAYQSYAQYLKRYPSGPRADAARLREAELLGIQDDWQGSLTYYQAILARQPEPDVALKARYGIGQAYFKLGRYRQAAQTLDSLTAVGDLPRSLWFSAQALQAEIALKQGDVGAAFSRLRLAGQDLASGDQEWFDDLKGRVVKAASPEDLERLASMYRDSPLSAALVLRLARLSKQAGQIGQTRKWIKVLQERYPDTAEATAGQRLLAGLKITLGCLLPLSGELSDIGSRVQRGMELAAGQAKVDLLFKDTQDDPGAATQQVRELAQDPRVLAILGPLTSGTAQAAAIAAQDAGVPLVALSQKGGLTRTGNLIFQAFLTPRQQVRDLVRGAVGLGIRRFAILYPDSAYGRTFLQVFQEELATAGFESAPQKAYTPGTQDFSQVLKTLKENLPSQATATGEATALFIPDDAGVVAAIAGQLANSPLKGVQILGTNLLHNPAIPPEQLTALQGVWFPDAFFAGDSDPAVQAFVATYQQQYGETPDYLAAQGYLAVRLFGMLSKSGEPLSRADLALRLQSLRAFSDLPWFRGFNPQREERTAIYLLTIREGQVQMVASRTASPGSQL